MLRVHLFAFFFASLFSGFALGYDAPFKILSFNIRVPVDPSPNDWASRKTRVADLIRRHRPDIVGLQESDPGPAYDLSGSTGLSLATRTNTGILYDANRLKVVETGEFYYTDTPDVEDGRLVWGQAYFRRCVWALFEERSSGLWFYTYNNHWDYISSAWQNSARLLASRIASRRHPDVPFIILGDLNVPEGDASLNSLKTQGPIRVDDSFRLIKPQAGQDGTFHAFQGRRDGPKIDFIFVQQGRWLTRDAGILYDNDKGLYPSDHFPIYAVIQ